MGLKKHYVFVFNRKTTAKNFGNFSLLLLFIYSLSFFYNWLSFFYMLALVSPILMIFISIYSPKLKADKSPMVAVSVFKLIFFFLIIFVILYFIDQTPAGNISSTNSFINFSTIDFLKAEDLLLNLSYLLLFFTGALMSATLFLFSAVLLSSPRSPLSFQHLLGSHIQTPVALTLFMTFFVIDFTSTETSIFEYVEIFFVLMAVFMLFVFFSLLSSRLIILRSDEHLTDTKTFLKGLSFGFYFIQSLFGFFYLIFDIFYNNNENSLVILYYLLGMFEFFAYILYIYSWLHSNTNVFRKSPGIEFINKVGRSAENYLIISLLFGLALLPDLGFFGFFYMKKISQMYAYLLISIVNHYVISLILSAFGLAFLFATLAIIYDYVDIQNRFEIKEFFTHHIFFLFFLFICIYSLFQINVFTLTINCFLHVLLVLYSFAFGLYLISYFYTLLFPINQNQAQNLKLSQKVSTFLFIIVFFCLFIGIYFFI